MPRKAEPDALKRLEGWLNASTGHERFMGCLNPATKNRFEIKAHLGNMTFYGRGKTLADAIHAALDAAEALTR